MTAIRELRTAEHPQYTDDDWARLVDAALAAAPAPHMNPTERDALIEVVSEHPRWTEENQCNLCPTDEPYEQHIAPLLAAEYARLSREEPTDE